MREQPPTQPGRGGSQGRLPEGGESRAEWKVGGAEGVEGTEGRGMDGEDGLLYLKGAILPWIFLPHAHPLPNPNLS